MKNILILVALTLSSLSLFADSAYLPTNDERARWTMADMSTLRIAIGAYKQDHGTYPPAKNADELRALIQPVYIKYAPLRDAWGRSFHYEAIADGSDYVLVSAGSDGVFQPRSELKAGKNTTTAEDAVADGTSRFFFRSWEYR